MLWRTIGGARTHLGCSRRTMPGKRLVVGVLCTVCIISGVYLKFYNHESADNLLKANRIAAVQDDSQAKPNFHRLKSRKNLDAETDNERGGAGQHHHQQGNERPGGVGQHHHQQGETSNEEQHEQVEGQNERTFNRKTKEDGGDDVIVEEFGEDRDKENAPQGDGVLDEGQRIAEVPIERVDDHGEADEDNDHNEEVVDEGLRDAGGDAGERDDEVVADAKEGRGPHGIKIFDWDNWVKENDFVELGNIWGYCDDENPPIIGKVLLLQDEESGRLKNILIFNTTMEYDIVMGRAEVSIDYNDMHFYSHTFDLESLEQEGEFFLPPILKGDHYFVREQLLSRLVPKGHYYGEARMIDQNEKVVICSTMHLTIK